MLVIEVLLSSIFVFLVFSVGISKTAPNVFGPIAFGLFTLVATLIALPVSGASLNIVRSLGPAVLARDYTLLVVYIVGGLAGSLAGVFFEYVFLKRVRK